MSSKAKSHVSFKIGETPEVDGHKTNSGDSQHTIETKGQGHDKTKNELEIPTQKNIHESESTIEASAGFLTRTEQRHMSYGYRTLFRFCTKTERLFLILGLLCALAAGVCVPITVWQFGVLTNEMTLIEIVDHDLEFKDKSLATVNTIYGSKAPFCIPGGIPDDIMGIFKTEGKTRNEVIQKYINVFVLNHSIIATALALFSFTYFLIWFICGENIINRLSVAYFEAMLRKDMKWMDTRPENTDHVNSIVEHTQRIREGIGERVATGGFLVSVFGASVTLAFIMGYELTLVACAAIPLLIGATSVVAATGANQVVEETKAYAKAGGLAEEVLLNIRTVMVYGAQKMEFASFLSKLDSGQGKVLKRTIYSSLANGLVWFVTYANYAVSFWYGSDLVLKNREKCVDGEPSYTPMDLVIIFFGIMFGAINIGLAFPIIESMIVARKSSKEVFRIIDTTSEVDNLSLDGFAPGTPAKGEIELTDVFFTYPARKNVPILRGVSFKITPGMTVALVGTSGCGKSTILKLLTKEYLVDCGFIKLDGYDLRTYNTVWLRNQIAVVTQESSLFDDTIEENVKIGNPDASFIEVQEACKQANAHDFICLLKKGYQTMVGFQGNKLSGGQRQRISIARALIRNPRILLLDEPTSALDNQSEAVVQEALNKASKNRTTLVVAHRLNTIINSDLILVFHKGKITERGTHSSLLAQKGLYYQLATGTLDKPSSDSDLGLTSDLPNEKQRAMSLVAGNERRKSRHSSNLKPLIVTPNRNTIGFNISDKVQRRLDKLSLEEEEDSKQNDELIFTINPIRHPSSGGQGQGDPSASVVSETLLPKGGHSHPAARTTFHNDEEIQKENELWEKYTQGIEKRSKVDPNASASAPAPAHQPKKQKSKFFAILKMVMFYPGLTMIGVIGSIFMGCTLPLYGVLFGRIVGQFANPDSEEALKEATVYSLLFLAVGVLAGVSVFTQSFTLNLAGFKAVNLVRKRLLFAILRQDVGWFDDPDNGIANLNTRLNQDAGSTQYILISFFGVLVQCFATVSIAIAYCFFFAWRLTAYSLVLVPIVIGASWLDGSLTKAHEQKTSDAMEELSKIVLEVFQNRRIVLTSQLERYFIAKYKKTLLSTGKSGWKIGIKRSLAYGFAQSVAFLTYSVCIYLAGFEITESGVKYQDVITVGDGLIFALLSVGQSLAIIPSFVKAIAAGNRILKILRTRPKFDFNVGGKEIKSSSGAIDFKEVHFWYPHATDVHILKGISFSINPGQMVALVGSSGSGKSTCVQLVLRFHDTTKGSVTLDGINLKELNCASMRSHMALVEQEPRLFDRTVEENIAYGDNTRMVRVDEVIAAAKAANIHTFITSLPEGYQTFVGGGSGSLLSGGQKQRIAIARALLRNPQILILDEATAALDRESEKIVQESLEIARRGRSCLAVAHRLSSIAHADLIVVMHQGNIVEFGSHSSLLDQKGLYYLLWISQNPMANQNSGVAASLTGMTAATTTATDVAAKLAEFENKMAEKPPEPGPSAGAGGRRKSNYKDPSSIIKGVFGQDN